MEQIMREYEKNMVKGGMNKDNKAEENLQNIRQKLLEQKVQKELLLKQKKK